MYLRLSCRREKMNSYQWVDKHGRATSSVELLRICVVEKIDLKTRSRYVKLMKLQLRAYIMNRFLSKLIRTCEIWNRWWKLDSTWAYPWKYGSRLDKNQTKRDVSLIFFFSRNASVELLISNRSVRDDLQKYVNTMISTYSLSRRYQSTLTLIERRESVGPLELVTEIALIFPSFIRVDYVSSVILSAISEWCPMTMTDFITKARRS